MDYLELFDKGLTKNYQKIVQLRTVMKINYDFHIHTALSACGLEEMSPNNIVNMSRLMELDVIAVTDHNSCKNAEVIMKVGKEQGLLVIPGMEIESREEIHVVCLFGDLDSVYNMQKLVYSHLPDLKNRSSIVGHQWIMDTDDEICGEEERLLSFATGLTFEQIIQSTWELGGIAIPAHIDRPSYSVLSNLGMLPANSLITCLEISQYADYNEYKATYRDYGLLQSSDSHELGFIGVCQQALDIPELTKEQLNVNQIIQFLRQYRG